MDAAIAQTIIIDWLSFTCQVQDPRDVIRFLGLMDCPWIERRGKNGYRMCLSFLDITVCYDGQPGMGIWCEMSGQGCRAFERISSMGWDALLRLLHQSQAHITRLDIAGDDRAEILPLPKLVSDARAGNYVSKAKSVQLVQTYDTCGVCEGTTINIGSPQSLTKIRIYDKAAEQGKPDDGPWVRVELQLRNERAGAMLHTILNSSVGEAYGGVLLHYLRFVQPQKDDRNKSRWPMRRYWQRYIGTANRISLYSAPGLDYTEAQCKHYVIEQAGNAVDACLKMYGVEKFLELVANRHVRQNPKYSQIVEKYHAKRGKAALPQGK